MTPTDKEDLVSDSDTPEGFVHATFVGAAPRHFPALGVTVEPGERHLIPQAIADEYADVFRNAREAAPSTVAKEAPATTTEGKP